MSDKSERKMQNGTKPDEWFRGREETGKRWKIEAVKQEKPQIKAENRKRGAPPLGPSLQTTAKALGVGDNVEISAGAFCSDSGIRGRSSP